MQMNWVGTLLFRKTVVCNVNFGRRQEGHMLVLLQLDIRGLPSTLRSEDLNMSGVSKQIKMVERDVPETCLELKQADHGGLRHCCCTSSGQI